MPFQQIKIPLLGLSHILDFIYPPSCLCCNEFIEEPDQLVCSDCWNRIAEFDLPFCLCCREILIDGRSCPKCTRDDFLPVFALGNYVIPLKEAVHRFKYGGFKTMGVDLADRLIDKHVSSLEKLKIDIVVPIPLHSYREKKRGFNQAVILSDIIGKRLEIPVENHGLLKVKRTKDQTKLDPRRRELNIKGAFRVSGSDLMNKKILMVDDVITTGATILEARKVLIDSGARPVAVCAVAVAGLS